MHKNKTCCAAQKNAGAQGGEQPAGVGRVKGLSQSASVCVVYALNPALILRMGRQCHRVAGRIVAVAHL